MRKVSGLRRELIELGLVGINSGRRAALMAALMPSLAGAQSRISAETLAQAADLAVPELRDQVEQLRAVGFSVTGSDSAGYALTQPFDDVLVSEAVLALLIEHMATRPLLRVGLPYRYLARCGSTSRLLKEEATVLPSGALMVTDDQTEGRGRLGRSWSSAAGEDLTFSVLLRPSISPQEAPLLSLGAAVAVSEALETCEDLEGRVRVKWPNDVLIDDRKVCGILLESSSGGESLEWVVVGIGLNVNSDPGARMENLRQSELEAWHGKPQPTSLKTELGREVARGRLLADLVARLDTYWFDTGSSELLAQMRARDALRGRRVEVLSGHPGKAAVVAGEATGVGCHGELLVRDGTGLTVPVFAGEVTLNVDR